MHARRTRVVRGLIAAGFATFVASLSHTAGGDAPPSTIGVVASLVLSIAVCTALAGRALSWWRMTASVGFSQVMFHGLFSGPGATVQPESHHGAVAVIEGHHADSRMLLAHVVAGILTLLALRFGERALLSLRDSARLALTRVLVWAAPLPRPRAARTLAPVRMVALPRELPALCLHPRRGPPTAVVPV